MELAPPPQAQQSRHTPGPADRATRTDRRPTNEDVEEYRSLTSAWGLRPYLAELLADRL